MAISEALTIERLLNTITDDGMNTGAEQSISEMMNTELKELVAQCLRLGKKGSFSLRLDIVPEGRDGVSIHPEWTAKKPKAKTNPFVGYADPRGNITAEHPHQQKLDIQNKVANIV